VIRKDIAYESNLPISSIPLSKSGSYIVGVNSQSTKIIGVVYSYLVDIRGVVSYIIVIVVS